MTVILKIKGHGHLEIRTCKKDHVLHEIVFDF